MIGLLALAITVCAFAEPVSQLNATNYVNDFAGVLDAGTVTRLNDVCRQIEEKAKAQIAVVTVKSTDGQDITSYAVALYQQWGIGKKGSDHGVLILLAVQDHKYWTTVGYGLEPILPDGKVGGFGREAIPLLRANDYAGAVSLITLRVANVIAQDAGVTLENAQAPAMTRPIAPPKPSAGAMLALIVIAVLVVWALSKAGGGGRGGGSGFLSGLLCSILFSNMTGGGRRSGGGDWGGGGFGGGGGGFGGFGGGSTGGGGAGGSW
jgi:uncharacterized protein